MVGEREGVVILLRIVGVEGRAGWLERLGTLGVLRVVIRRSEELPIERLGVDEILGLCTDGVLGEELGRRLPIEKPPRLLEEGLLVMLRLGREGRLDRVGSDRLRVEIRLDDELRMDGLEMLGEREGDGRDTELRLGVELGLDTCPLERVLLPELRRRVRPSQADAISTTRATARAIMTDFASFFSLSTNIEKLLSPAVFHPGQPGLPFRCCRRFDASDEIGRQTYYNYFYNQTLTIISLLLQRA